MSREMDVTSGALVATTLSIFQGMRGSLASICRIASRHLRQTSEHSYSSSSARCLSTLARKCCSSSRFPRRLVGWSSHGPSILLTDGNFAGFEGRTAQRTTMKGRSSRDLVMRPFILRVQPSSHDLCTRDVKRRPLTVDEHEASETAGTLAATSACIALRQRKAPQRHVALDGLRSSANCNACTCPQCSHCPEGSSVQAVLRLSPWGVRPFSKREGETGVQRRRRHVSRNCVTAVTASDSRRLVRSASVKG